MLYLDPSVLVFFLGKGKIRCFHAVTRRNIVVSSNLSGIFDLLAEGAEERELEHLLEEQKERFSFADATNFNLWECMYNNPDFLAESLDKADFSVLNGRDMIASLKKSGFISEKRQPVYALSKKSVLDRYKGNINEQIATEALYRKTPIEQWWLKQKFSDGNGVIGESAYKYSQDKFLKGYFKDNLQGKEVLEIGCGTGLYTAQMAQNAKLAYGLDYEKKYIDVARSRHQKLSNVHFIVKDIVQDLTDKDFDGHRFDHIFMIDIFLFFFDKKFQSALAAQREKVLSQIKDLLKPDGILTIVDPHLFWLIPRFGHPQFPYGILTEYKNKRLGVTPTLEEMTGLFFKAGLAVRRVWEPGIDEKFKEIDEMGYHFIHQFPQWIVIELQRRDQK